MRRPSQLARTAHLHCYKHNKKYLFFIIIFCSVFFFFSLLLLFIPSVSSIGFLPASQHHMRAELNWSSSWIYIWKKIRIWSNEKWEGKKSQPSPSSFSISPIYLLYLAAIGVLVCACTSLARSADREKYNIKLCRINWSRTDTKMIKFSSFGGEWKNFWFSKWFLNCLRINDDVNSVNKIEMECKLHAISTRNSTMFARRPLFDSKYYLTICRMRISIKFRIIFFSFFVVNARARYMKWKM